MYIIPLFLWIICTVPELQPAIFQDQNFEGLSRSTSNVQANPYRVLRLRPHEMGEGRNMPHVSEFQDRTLALSKWADVGG